MQTVSTLKSLVLGAALLACSSVHADRPLVSETADVIPGGACQVEAWAARLTSRGSPSQRSDNAIVSCGWAGKHQFAIGVARDRAGSETARGLSLGGKTTLLMPSEGVTGFGVAYTLGFERAPGDSYEFEDSSVLAVVTRELTGGLLAHANLGWTRSRSVRQSSTLWSLGVETSGEPALAADVYGDDRGRPWVSAGAGWALLERLSFNAAFSMHFERPRLKQLSIGVKFQF